MSELATRAKELAMDLEMVTYPHSEHVLDKLEQALLAERRLARLEDAELVKQFLDDEWVLTFKLSATTIPNKCAAQLRAAAEKEVGDGR